MRLIETDEEGNPLGDVPVTVDPNVIASNLAFSVKSISSVIDRLEYYQASEFHTFYNAVALGHLYAAAEALAEAARVRKSKRQDATG